MTEQNYQQVINQIMTAARHGEISRTEAIHRIVRITGVFLRGN